MVTADLLRQLAGDARQRAALAAMADPEHAFYEGVVAAVEDRLHPPNLDIHGEAWLARQAAPFREGYVKGLAVVAGARPETARLLLPEPAGGPSL